MSTLLVLAAMQEEEAALLEEMRKHSEARPVEFSAALDVRATEFLGGDRRVLIARSGMGPVNAAVTLALIAEKRKLDTVLLLGVGGALVDRLNIGELVISSVVLQHDSVFSLEFGDHRVRSGEMIFTPEDAARHEAVFVADSGWVARLRAASPGAHVGALLSGNEFVGTVTRKSEVARLHPEALLVDMEGAGVAHVAARLGLPFVVAKTVADRLSPDGGIHSDFKASLLAAARNAAGCLRGMV